MKDAYLFPSSIDPAAFYLFYLHGKIIEDQGLPAISPEHGEYHYLAILQTLSDQGFVVISERRSADTDSKAYAEQIAQHVRLLLKAGVPEAQITVAGASKGAAIAMFTSNILANSQLNFVLLSICNPEMVAQFIDANLPLYGRILSIYDTTDSLAGSCQNLFAFSGTETRTHSEEITLEIGIGHGLIYQPLEEWVTPLVQWARAE